MPLHTGGPLQVVQCASLCVCQSEIGDEQLVSKKMSLHTTHTICLVSCRIKQGGFKQHNRARITDGLFQATKLQMGNMLGSR